MTTSEALHMLEVMYRALRASDVLLAQSYRLLEQPIRHPGPNDPVPLDTTPLAPDAEDERRGAFPK
jgi:hypothetical protein